MAGSRYRRHNRRQGEKLQRFLRRAPSEMTAGVRRALRRAGEDVRDDAVDMASSERVRRALRMKSAVGVKSRGLVVEVGIRTKRQRELAWFAHFMEFGTAPHYLAPGSSRRSRRNKGRGPWHPGAVAKPFLTPAVEMNRAARRQMVAQEVTGAMLAVLRRS